MGMGNLQSKNCHTYPLANHGLIDGQCYFFCKYHHTGQEVILQVEEVIGFKLGNDQGMPFGQRINIQECVIAFILMNPV